MNKIKVITSDSDLEFQVLLNDAHKDDFVIIEYQVASMGNGGLMHCAILKKKGDWYDRRTF